MQRYDLQSYGVLVMAYIVMPCIVMAHVALALPCDRCCSDSGASKAAARLRRLIG